MKFANDMAAHDAKQGLQIDAKYFVQHINSQEEEVVTDTNTLNFQNNVSSVPWV